MPQYKKYTWHFEIEADTSDERARAICNNLGAGGNPKTDIQIEERPSHVEGMAVFVFTYTAPIPDSELPHAAGSEVREDKGRPAG
jgi:hypothetical protein